VILTVTMVMLILQLMAGYPYAAAPVPYAYPPPPQPYASAVKYVSPYAAVAGRTQPVFADRHAVSQPPVIG